MFLAPAVPITTRSVLAPVGLVAVAAVLIVTAVTVREDPAVRAVSVLWSLLALAGVYRLLTRMVVRAELTDTVLRWRSFTGRGELPLASVRSVRSGFWSRSVTVEADDGRRVSFASGPAIRDLVADLRRAAPYVDVRLTPVATRESILEPVVERHLQIANRGMYTYRRTG